MVKLAKVRGLVPEQLRLEACFPKDARARRRGEEGLRAVPGAFEGAMLREVSRDWSEVSRLLASGW